MRSGKIFSLFLCVCFQIYRSDHLVFLVSSAEVVSVRQNAGKFCRRVLILSARPLRSSPQQRATLPIPDERNMAVAVVL